jgi:ribosomal RNA-processing protein 12
MLLQFCCAILGETATMRASGVIGLCILILEHRFDMVLMNRIIEIFPSVCLLLQQQCVEQTRAVLSFVRVCASVFEIDLLQSFLPQLIKAFTEDVGTLKGKFSFRIRAILRKLVDRIGEEPLEPFLSESDKALLGYICKQKRRLKKKRELKVHDMVEKLLDSDDDDSSDEENDMDVAETIGGSSEKYNHEDPRLLSRPKATRVKDTMNSFPSSLEDLLEDQAPSFQRHHRATDPIVMSKIKRKVNEIETNDTAPSGDANGDDNEIYDVIFSPNDGKIIIQEKSQDKSNDTTDKKSRKFSSEAVAAASHAIQNKKQKLYGKLPGEEYRSKKAGGDMWKKGMLEPHAFVPLDPRLLSKKNHAEAMVKFGAFSGTNKTKSSNLKKTSGFRNRDVVGNRKQKKSHQAHHKNN